MSQKQSRKCTKCHRSKQKIHEIMETVYADLKGKQIYRNIQQNLMEASKHYLTCTKQPLTERSLQNFHTSLEKLFQLISPIQQEQLQYQIENEIKINFITNLPNVQHYNTIEVNPKSSSHSRISPKNLSTIKRTRYPSPRG